jgi:muramoyltetrapeptide carboxypeptidase
MERRSFLRNITSAGLACSSSLLIPSFVYPSTKNEISITPRSLSEGDTIGIISPSGAVFDSEPYKIAIETFEAMGLKVKMGKYVSSRFGHLAGTDRERADELNDMFRDDQIKGIIALRGGSGAARILDMIDYELIAKNPKIFIGYSDITALHLAIYAKTGLVTFHGPLAVSSWNDFSYPLFRRLLFDRETLLYKNPESTGNNLVQVKNRIRTITPGKAKGILMGGNLSVLTGLVGTPYLPQWENRILYLEEIGEKIYAIDRMMSQLKMAGILQKISGFVFGKCSSCEPGGSGYGSLTLRKVVGH